MTRVCYLAILTICTCLCATGQSSSAKSQPAAAPSDNKMTQKQIDDNIDLMRQDVRSERKKLVAANMPLTDTEATKFWPVYDRYVTEQTKLNDARYAIIKEYAQSYQSMTDAQANSLIKRWIESDQDDSQLRLRYIPEFEKVISPKKTALFFQIDRRLGMMVDLQLGSEIPLAKQ